MNDQYLVKEWKGDGSGLMKASPALVYGLAELLKVVAEAVAEGKKISVNVVGACLIDLR